VDDISKKLSEAEARASAVMLYLALRFMTKTVAEWHLGSKRPTKDAMLVCMMHAKGALQLLPTLARGPGGDQIERINNEIERYRRLLGE